MATEPTPIGQNYTTDYSPYYLDFASTLGDFSWEDFGGGEGDLTDAGMPSFGSSGGSRSGEGVMRDFRSAARRLAAKRGISIREARNLIRYSAARGDNIGSRWMGADRYNDFLSFGGPLSGSAGGGGGTGSGGKRSGGGSGSGSGSGYGAIIAGLGLADGLFQPMIDQAIRNGWSGERLRAAILQSPQFEYLFPGIKREDGSLRMTAGEYRQIADSYTAIAKEFGLNLSRQRVGFLVSGAVSPQEFYQRVAALDKVRTNEGLRESFNEQLGQFGLKPLDQQGWFKFLAGVGGKDYYDVYEAAQLRASGLNIDSASARTVAQSIGDAGSPLDIGSLVSEARTALADIGPELLREGITDADLVQMAAGYDPKGLEPKLRTILANRRATGAFVPGSRATSSGEGTTVFTRDQAAAY